MDRAEFEFKNIKFVVKRSEAGNLIYRDRAHTFGPWSNVAKSLSNKSLDRTFRYKLKLASAAIV